MTWKHTVELIDDLDPSRRVSVTMEHDDGSGQLFIRAAGYGDACSDDGHGIPLAVELYDGRLRVVVWPDINREDSDTYELEGARETARKVDA